MAFPLQQVLKALLLSSQQPLAIKEIQATFARFHDPAFAPAASVEESPSAKVTEDASASAEATADAPAEVEAAPVEADDSGELYRDVPSLVTAAQIREAMEAIAAELSAANQGLVLVEGPGGYRLATHPRFARWIRLLRQEQPPARLSPSSLETLAVVAYRQPITRLEIETIRGVSAEAGLNKLLERELIAVVGRAEQPGRPLQYGTTERFLEFVGVKSLDELPASDVLTSRQIDEWLQNATNPRRPGDAEMGLGDEALAAASPAPASQAG